MTAILLVQLVCAKMNNKIISRSQGASYTSKKPSQHARRRRIKQNCLKVKQAEANKLTLIIIVNYNFFFTMRSINKSCSSIISHSLWSIPVEGEYRLSTNDLLIQGGRSPEVPTLESAKILVASSFVEPPCDPSLEWITALELSGMCYLRAHLSSPLLSSFSSTPRCPIMGVKSKLLNNHASIHEGTLTASASSAINLRPEISYAHT
jgi:hypothetical protein